MINRPFLSYAANFLPLSMIVGRSLLGRLLSLSCVSLVFLLFLPVLDIALYPNRFLFGNSASYLCL